MANSRERRKLRREQGLPTPLQMPKSQTNEPIPSVPKSNVPDTVKLLRGLLASGVLPLVVGGIYEYLALAGVVDDMNAARLVLISAWLVGTAGILISELVWGKSTKSKVVYSLGGAPCLALIFVFVDERAIGYRNKHKPLPVSSGAAVLIQPGGKWKSRGDTVYGSNGKAIENGGDIDSQDLQVNPPTPRAPRPETPDEAVLDQLIDFDKEINNVRDSNDLQKWSTKVVDYMRTHCDEKITADFLEQRNLFKKQKALTQCRRAVLDKLNSN